MSIYKLPEMSHKGEIFLLRCWKCRKCVADSHCLVQDEDCERLEGVDSSASREACGIWHLEAEASPDWIKQEIEKVDWTANKLNCPYCKTRLGAFNFVNTTKCSCGHLVIIHLCKRKTDVGFPLSLAIPLLSPSKSHKDSSTTDGYKMKEPPESSQSQSLMTADQCMVPCEVTMEALCLEVPKSREHLERNSLATASKDKRTTCIKWHHKSKSLDLDIQNWLKVNTATIQLKQRQSDISTNAEHSSAKRRTLGCLDEPSESIRAVFNGQPHIGESNSNPFSPSFSNLMPTRSTLGEDVVQSIGRESSPQVLHPGLTSSTATIQRLSKKERNKLKSLRRKQRKREMRLHEHKQINKTSLWSDEDEEENIKEKESYICAVCLDIYFNPYMCHPCQHIFCEPCLRTLARDNPSRTPCPLCRAVIAKVYFQTDLSKSSADCFPNEYLNRSQSFQRANSAKWPLPSCSRLFRVFGDFRRHVDPVRRRQFPHGGYRFDFEDESHGWRFNLDMIIIYIFSVNWVIGFIVCCLLSYVFLFSG